MKTRNTTSTINFAIINIRRMGASASSLPDQLSETDMKNVCGDNYKPVYFKAMHDKSSVVSRDFFIKTSDGHEKEVFDLFIHFCPQGEMDSRTFVKLLKDTKSMKKNKFSTTDADLIFSKHKTKQGGGVKVLNYCVFRNDMVPDIVAKMGGDVDAYITKLSRCEGPTLHGVTHPEATRFHDDKSTYTGAHTHGGPSVGNESGQVDISNILDRSDADVRGVVLQNEAPVAEKQEEQVVEQVAEQVAEQAAEQVEVSDEKHAAALKVQQAHRSKSAKQHVQALKEIKDVATTDEFQFDTPKEDCDNEAKLRVLFTKFCPTGEMDSRTFIKLMKDSQTVDRKFTSGDADLIFQKTKAAASHPSAGAYSAGVVHGKRVNFELFRAVSVLCIAEKKGMSVEQYVAFLSQVDGPTLHGTTTAEAVRFHDDQSTFTGTQSAKLTAANDPVVTQVDHEDV